MNLFENMLKGNESLFLNPIALDFDYQPKLILHREFHQKRIAECIKPLFKNRTGKNIIISGVPGVGKTVCLKHVLNELKEETDDIFCIYINCWKKDSSFKAIMQICEDIGYAWIHNKSYEELIPKVIETINKKSAVIVLDEADKLADMKIVYTLLDDLYRKSMILITNEKNFVMNIDKRINSRLAPEHLEFEHYTKDQVRDILKERSRYAFVQGALDSDLIEVATEKAFLASDIRMGLNLLRLAAEEAENSSSKQVRIEHVKSALTKIEPTNLKKISEEAKQILEIIKKNEGNSILSLYSIYKANSGGKSYRTFHRRLKELEELNAISIKEINKGFEDGRTNEVEIVK